MAYSFFQKSISVSLLFLLAALLFLSCSKAGFQELKRVRFLALGDSYTIGQSVRSAYCWPNLLADRLEVDAEIDGLDTRIIAATGWRTDNLMDAIDAANLPADYGLVGLLIGVNNQFQGRTLGEYEREFAELLDRSIALANGDKTHVFVVSIPDYGYTPFGADSKAEISAALDAFNSVNRALTEAVGVAYYDITPISRRGLDEPALVAKDGLHPSGAQYAAWVSAFGDDVLGQLEK